MSKLKGNYHAVSAKIKAMHSFYLTEADYEQLLSKHSVGDVCAYLKNSSGYAGVLAGVNDREIHRLDLENLLKNEVRNEYTRVYRFVEREQRKMLRFWFERDEIEFIKHCMRYVLSGESGGIRGVGKYITPFFREHTKINLELMEKARNFDELTEACRDTDYYGILIRASQSGADMFSAAMLLDRYYYQSLWRDKDKYMSSEDAKSFALYIGQNIDMLNILWIYRSKKYFDVDSEMIYTYLIPVRYRLSQEDMRALVEASGYEAIEEYILKTPYAPLFQNIKQDYFVEENYNRLIYRLVRRLYKQEPLSMTSVFAYFTAKNIEIRNLQTIIEGIRYGFQADAIREHLCV